MLSITMPTRKRPERLRHCIHSCVDLADNPGDLEFLLYVDDDDNETRHEELQSEFPGVNIQIFVAPRLFNLYTVQNFLAARSHGCPIGYLADDMYFTTQGWDTRVKQPFIHDKIWLVFPNDTENPHGRVRATHGFLSRKAIKIVRAFVPNCFTYYWGDQWLSVVYKKLGRSVCLKDVMITHENPLIDPAYVMHLDDTYRDKCKDRDYMKIDHRIYKNTEHERREWMRKLRDYIAQWQRRHR